MKLNTTLTKEIHILYMQGGNYAHSGFAGFLEQLGCKVTTVSNEDQLFENYHETQINAFNIFGGEKYHCIFFDVFSSIQNSYSAIKRLKEAYAELPPLIALTTPEQSLLQNNFIVKGFDFVIGFPMSDKEFIVQLKGLLGIEDPVFDVSSTSLLPDDQMEGYPVISLKTYSAILTQAGRNNFSLLPVYKAFLCELDSYIRKFIDAYENNDRSIYEPTIVAIRGLCATMGATQVYQIANRIETSSRKELFEEVGALLPYLIEKFLVLKEFISQWKRDQTVIAA